MKIGIVGSRRRNEYSDYQAVEKALIGLIKERGGEGVTLVSGGCPKGGDRFAEQLAKKYNLTIILHRAEWDKYGKGAGFIRNTYIAEDSDVLIACVASDRKGGTEDTIKKYLKLGKTQLKLV